MWILQMNTEVQLYITIHISLFTKNLFICTIGAFLFVIDVIQMQTPEVQ